MAYFSPRIALLSLKNSGFRGLCPIILAHLPWPDPARTSQPLAIAGGIQENPYIFKSAFFCIFPSFSLLTSQLINYILTYSYHSLALVEDGMDLKERVLQIKKKALGEIEVSARMGDTQKIIANTKVVEESEKLLRRWEEMCRAVEFLEKGAPSKDRQVGGLSPSPAQNKELDDDLTPRVRGEMRRKELLNYLSMIGIHLLHKHGSLYQTRNNEIVGIAYASERRPNRWFLGLPDQDYHTVVLMCDKDKRGDDSKVNFILPRLLYDQVRPQLSKVNDQVKFNIVIRRNSYMLLIPNGDPINIDNYIDLYDSL
jgi:hypothetical protein